MLHILKITISVVEKQVILRDSYVDSIVQWCHLTQLRLVRILPPHSLFALQQPLVMLIWTDNDQWLKLFCNLKTYTLL